MQARWYCYWDWCAAVVGKQLICQTQAAVQEPAVAAERVEPLSYEAAVLVSYEAAVLVFRVVVPVFRVVVLVAF